MRLLFPHPILSEHTLRYLALVTGSAVVLIGFSTLVGYTVELPLLYQWGRIPMAINTATAFLLTGVALISLSVPHVR